MFPGRKIRGKEKIMMIIKQLVFLVLFFLSLQVSSTLAISSSSRPKNVIIVGGSSGMGKAAALETIKHGGKVLLISRSEDKLNRAKKELMSKVEEADISIYPCDVSNEENVKKMSESLDSCWDGLVISAAGKAPHGPVESLPTADTRNMMESKVWTAYHCAKHIGPKLSSEKSSSSIVFVAGILNRRPGLNCAPLAMANGALEGLTRSLALEWGPKNIRVNCLSPGFCDTERFDHMDKERKERMLINTAASLPVQRVGKPSDMGEAIYYLLTAPFCTGIILDVDGGHGIQQYANSQTDPMRKQ